MRVEPLTDEQAKAVAEVIANAHDGCARCTLAGARQANEVWPELDFLMLVRSRLPEEQAERFDRLEAERPIGSCRREPAPPNGG